MKYKAILDGFEIKKIELEDVPFSSLTSISEYNARLLESESMIDEWAQIGARDANIDEWEILKLPTSARLKVTFKSPEFLDDVSSLNTDEFARKLNKKLVADGMIGEYFKRSIISCPRYVRLDNELFLQVNGRFINQWIDYCYKITVC
jgi:hypothetical protein